MKQEILELLVKLLSVSTLFSMGAEASGQALKNEIKSRCLWFALGWSVALFPAIVWVFGQIFIEEKNLMLGIFLAASSAGGSSAGIFVKQLKGNKAFSGSLMIAQAICSVILIPIFAIYLSPENGDLTAAFLPLLLAIFLYQLLPFAIGSAMNPWNYRFTSIFKLIDKFNALLLLLMVAGFIVINFRSLFHVQLSVLIFVLSVNLILFFASPLYRWMGNKTLIKTLSATIGIRNLTTSFFISSIFGFGTETQLGILMYGFFMYVSAVVWSIVVSRRQRVGFSPSATKQST